MQWVSCHVAAAIDSETTTRLPAIERCSRDAVSRDATADEVVEVVGAMGSKSVHDLLDNPIEIRLPAPAISRKHLKIGLTPSVGLTPP
jgi:hypothetical protein